MKQLIVITTPVFFDGEAEILTQLFREGMTRLHIRKPGCKETGLEELIDRIPVSFHRHIVLHDHFGLAVRGGLHGIHLNSRNGNIPAGFTGSVSRSCHTLNELAGISAYDYVFLSPVFSSISKEGYPSAFSLATLKQAAVEGSINGKVIALGGIDRNTMTEIAHLPFGGVAVLGALWGRNGMIRPEEVIDRFHTLRQCIAEYRKI